jgi:glycosyltransferase involved in cell wall biosynthesis
MPTSWYQTIPVIVDKVIIENPKSILDIGIGFGKYGVILREVLDLTYERYEKEKWQIKIDGIEAFKGYKNLIHDYVYNNIYYEPIEKVLPMLGMYDVITLIDVLEHFDKHQGTDILHELLKHTKKALIISTPINPGKQNEYNGNIFEAHKSKWAITDFVSFDMDFCLLDIGDNKALILKLYPTDENKDKNIDILLKDNQLLKYELPASDDSMINQNPKMKIAYVLPHKNLTGGMKMLVEQIKWLKSRGHKLDVYFKGDTNETSALPDWNKISVDNEIIVPLNESFEKYIRDCDVIILGWLIQLPELANCNIPLMYWEQGNEWLFGDYKDLNASFQYRQMLKKIYSMPCVISSVSDFIADIFLNRYGRKTAVIPNGIDTDAFFPGNPSDEDIILLIGNPALPFKGFDDALHALDLVWRNGHIFKVNWICQIAPRVHGISFPLNFIVNPPQIDLPEYYRQAKLVLFTSWYEGFGMPPLESMASGVPVICTDSGGVNMYLKPFENALIVDVCDTRAIAGAVTFMLENKDARTLLSSNGIKTALDFKLEKSFIKLENLLYKIKAFYNNSTKK